MNKYEQLIEHIINDDEAKARALFHQIVVERSREIYESLMDEDPAVSDNQVEDLTAEVTGDEEGMHEADDDMDMPGDDMDGAPGDDLGDLDGDMGDMGGDSDAPATKSDIMDLESAIDELKAEFDRLMNDVDQDGDGDHDMEDHDAEDADSDDEESGEEPGEEDDDSDDDEAGKNPFAEGKKAKKANMTEAERIREYVEKVGTDWDKGAYKGPKGENVGTGDKSERQGEKNTKSPVAGKNDMGGTTANILSGKGATEAAPDGQRPNGKAGGFLKSPQEIDVAKRNVNKPGGNKGAQNYYDTRASAKSGEQSVNANSPLNGAPGRAK
jgi:hypothetical protein